VLPFFLPFPFSLDLSVAEKKRDQNGKNEADSCGSNSDGEEGEERASESESESGNDSGTDHDTDTASGDEAAQVQQPEEDAKHGNGNGNDGEEKMAEQRRGGAKAKSIARWEPDIRQFEISSINDPPFNRQGKFEICAKVVALTYSGIPEDSPLTIDRLTQELISRFHLVQLLVGKEDHVQPGRIHYHVFLQLFKLHSRNIRLFDVDHHHPYIRTIPQKGQYAGSRGRLRWISYILKQSALTRDHVRSYRFSVFSSYKTFKRDYDNHVAFITFHQNMARFVPPEYPIRVNFLNTPLSINIDVQWHHIRVEGRELPAWKEPEKKRHWLIIGEPDRGKTTSIRVALTKDLKKPHGQCFSFYDVPPALNGRYDRYAGQDILLFDDVAFPTKEELLALSAFHYGEKQMSARYENAVLRGSQARVILLVANEFPPYHNDNWFTSRFHMMNLDPLTIFPPAAATAAAADDDVVRNNSAASRPHRSNAAAIRARAAPIPAPGQFSRVTQAAPAAMSSQLPLQQFLAAPTFPRAPSAVAAVASLGYMGSSSSSSSSFSSPPPSRAPSISTAAIASRSFNALTSSSNFAPSASHCFSSASWPNMSCRTTTTAGSNLQYEYPGTSRAGDHTVRCSPSSFPLHSPAYASLDGSANRSPQQQQQQWPPAVGDRSFTPLYPPPPPPPSSSSSRRELVFSPFPSQDAMDFLNQNSAGWFA
jgi:hypothetical protein